jgi:hypothetical protein
VALKPESVHDLAEAVLACVCQALEETAAEVAGQPGCPCRSCVVAGEPAWDCDDQCGADGHGVGGQLTVHVARMWPSTDFPAEDRTVRGQRSCPLPATTAVELVVTLLRCAPTVDEQGCPPSCGDLAEAARTVHVDAATVHNAVVCCVADVAARGRRFVLGGQRILPAEGGCHGVEQRVVVALPGCAPCPQDGGR